MAQTAPTAPLVLEGSRDRLVTQVSRETKAKKVKEEATEILRQTPE